MSDAPILLDVSRLVWRQWTRRLPTGIDRVCLAYLEHFGARARAVVQFRNFRHILNRSDSDRLFNLLVNGSGHFRARLTTILATAAMRGERRAGGQVYLNVGHTGLNSSYLRPWLTENGLRPVFLIHDLIPITHPQYCREGEAIRHAERIGNALASARGIVVNSRATEQDLAQFARQRGMPMPPCLVAWLGVEPPAALPLPASTTSDRPYFVTVGTIEARKNHRMILDVWTELVARMGQYAPELVIIGQRGWEARAAIDLLDRPGPLRGHIREMGRCNDMEMNRLMAGARALLMPSFVEGFGLPLIEALQMGTPVIASDLDVFREIAGDVPEYRGSADNAGWLQAVLDYAGDDGARERQLSRMGKFRAPQWNDHFECVEQFLGSI
jgi:glycosyltransferase involved in cell wall biosynthesis